MPLPDRAPGAAGHIADHNLLHDLYNDLENVNLATQAELDAHVATPHGGGASHPDLAAHDALGVATQAELDAHVATSGHTHPDLAAHDALGLATQAELTAHSHAQVQTFAMAGTLTVRTGALRFRFPFAATLVGVSAVVGTAPTGASVIVDVNLNGTTVYTTQANRPTIAASQTVASETTPNTTAVSVGGLLSVDVDQVGSSVAGADLTVMVRYTPA